MTYRAIFISDIHLGSRHSQADALLEFMKDNESESLYLVGDIIDGWALKRRWVWPQEHSDVIQKLLRKARKGTHVTYVLGNHDEFVRSFLPLSLGDNLSIVNETTFTGRDGRRYLVTHGDFFDSITMTKKWLAKFGDISYTLLLKLNRPINMLRRLVGYRRYWSLSNYAKQSVKKAVMFIDDYETILAMEARRRHLDGVICGHIHHAEHKQIDGVTYLNCGDWVESCSAIAETMEGEWQIIRFHEQTPPLSDAQTPDQPSYAAAV